MYRATGTSGSTRSRPGRRARGPTPGGCRGIRTIGAGPARRKRIRNRFGSTSSLFDRVRSLAGGLLAARIIRVNISRDQRRRRRRRLRRGPVVISNGGGVPDPGGAGRRRSEPDDLLPGDHDARGPGDGLRLPDQRRLRSGQHLPEDAHVRRRRASGSSSSCASGSLSCSQSVITLLRRDFDQGQGLAQAGRCTTPPASSASRSAASPTWTARPWSRTSTSSTSTSSSPARSAASRHDLYLVYPQGNPLAATEDSPFLQIGECKYGRPILDRGVRYERTTLEDAARYALISIDSTIRSNVTVGPPIDLLVYATDD